MPISFDDAGLRALMPSVLADKKVTLTEARNIKTSVQDGAGVSGTEHTDLSRLLRSSEFEVDPAGRGELNVLIGNPHELRPIPFGDPKLNELAHAALWDGYLNMSEAEQVKAAVVDGGAVTETERRDLNALLSRNYEMADSTRTMLRGLAGVSGPSGDLPIRLGSHHVVVGREEEGVYRGRVGMDVTIEPYSGFGKGLVTATFKPEGGNAFEVLLQPGPNGYFANTGGIGLNGSQYSVGIDRDGEITSLEIVQPGIGVWSSSKTAPPGEQLLRTDQGWVLNARYLGLRDGIPTFSIHTEGRYRELGFVPAEKEPGIYRQTVDGRWVAIQMTTPGKLSLINWGGSVYRPFTDP